jgi:hypothetical protein
MSDMEWFASSTFEIIVEFFCEFLIIPKLQSIGVPKPRRITCSVLLQFDIQEI